MSNKVNAPYADQARAHLERLKADNGKDFYERHGLRRPDADTPKHPYQWAIDKYGSIEAWNAHLDAIKEEFPNF